MCIISIAFSALTLLVGRGADLHMAQLMPMPLTVSCFSKIQIGFSFLVLTYPGSPGQRAFKWVCVVVCSNNVSISHSFCDTTIFTLNVTACRGPNLEISFIFGKQLRLKTIDTFPFMYTHNVLNTCHIH